MTMIEPVIDPLTDEELDSCDRWVSALHEAGSMLPPVYAYLEALVAEVRHFRGHGEAESEESLSAYKHEMLARMLDSDDYVQIAVDARAADLPEHLDDNYQCILDIGYRMARPIPDLELDEDGVSATLSFGGSPYHCMVPWEAIWRIGGAVFMASAPQEILAKMRGTDPAQKPSKHALKSVPTQADAESPPRTAPTGTLRLVPDPEPDPESVA